jgi:5-formyltetrahydrofolate cyclo-ligase
MTDKSALRQLMRARRQQLSASRQLNAALALATRLQKQPLFQRSRRIAAYLPSDGEIDPMPLLHRAHRQGKYIYLPVLKGAALQFVRFRPGLTSMRPNRFGIPEPRALPAACIAPSQLDLVLMPLVAFDPQGGRLGMGSGFYDRTFAFKQARRQRSRPLLIGLAHQLQQVPALPSDPWDVPIAGVATEKALLLATNLGRHGCHRVHGSNKNARGIAR